MPSIDTPCTKVCVVHPTAGLCVGCGRSLAEIGGWTQFSDAERRRVMAELPRRLAALDCGAPTPADPSGGAVS